jgi:hypothetical protein
MLVVETIARVRRAHFVQGKSIKAIARELGLARNTVRNVLRSGKTVPATSRNHLFAMDRIGMMLPRAIST